MRKKLSILIGILILVLSLTACGSQSQASINNQQTAGDMWGYSPKIVNFYEYHQVLEIYELRDDPKLVLYVYLQSNTGQLVYLGKAKGFGVPYGTEQSDPANAEPNALYPSQNTNADWLQLIDPANPAVVDVTFAEPNLIITAARLPSTPLQGDLPPA